MIRVFNYRTGENLGNVDVANVLAYLGSALGRTDASLREQLQAQPIRYGDYQYELIGKSV